MAGHHRKRGVVVGMYVHRTGKIRRGLSGCGIGWTDEQALEVLDDLALHFRDHDDKRAGSIVDLLVQARGRIESLSSPPKKRDYIAEGDALTSIVLRYLDSASDVGRVAGLLYDVIDSGSVEARVPLRDGRAGEDYEDWLARTKPVLVADLRELRGLRRTDVSRDDAVRAMTAAIAKVVERDEWQRNEAGARKIVLAALRGLGVPKNAWKNLFYK